MKPWQHLFQTAMADGETYFNAGEYHRARLLFQEAYERIPEPQRNYAESTQALSGLADCFYFLENYEKAKGLLDDVLFCPGGAASPTVRLRRGQVFFKTGDVEKAKMELTAAYLNGGMAIFHNEEECMQLIADVIEGYERR